MNKHALNCSKTTRKTIDPIVPVCLSLSQFANLRPSRNNFCLRTAIGSTY